MTIDTPDETTRVRVTLPEPLADRIAECFGDEATSASEAVKLAAAEGCRARECGQCECRGQ